MSPTSDFHDQDFDALENYLEHLPVAPQRKPYLLRRFAVWRLGHKLARQKKREGDVFSAEATALYRQPLVATSGWLTASPVNTEMTKIAEDILVEKLSKRGLRVDHFSLIWTGMADGPDGSYQSFTARFNVS